MERTLKKCWKCGMSTAIRRLLLGDRLFSATIFSIRHERRGRLNHRQHVLLVSVPRESGTRPTEGDETRGGRGKKKSREGRPWAVTPFFALFGALPRRCVCEFLFRKRKKKTKCWKKNKQIGGLRHQVQQLGAVTSAGSKKKQSGEWVMMFWRVNQVIHPEVSGHFYLF